jgi:nucleoside-diphosphate-sugar epimerase
VNADGTGKLMSHLRHVSSFVVCSTASTYGYQGNRGLKEDDPYGLHIPNYSLTKIAAERIAQLCSREWQIPTTILRIFSLYSETSGGPTGRIDRVARGEEVVLHPDRPNNHSPIFVTDYCELAARAAEVAAVPPLVVNFAGSEIISVEDWCTYAAELLGTTAKLVFRDSAYLPMCADTTLMHEVLGRTQVSASEGVRRVIAARYPTGLSRTAG